MSDTVDLVVIGVQGDRPRAEMSRLLVKKFKQEAYTFEALLDGAYGESAPYVAQSDVELSLAEGGKDSLESVGLICKVLPAGEKPEKLTAPPAAEQSTVAQETEANSFDVDTEATDSALASFKSDDTQETETASFDEAPDTTGSALASFKSGDNVDAEEEFFDTSDSEELFDDEDVGGEGSALASFKKDTGKDKKKDNAAVDFGDELEVIGDTGQVSLGAAKEAKNKVDEVDDSVNEDFSDQIEDVGADQLKSGLKEAQQVKPKFDEDVAEIDFSDDVGSIGIHEADSVTPEVSKSKLAEEVAERNLASFPKEDAGETVDFSDELEVLSSDHVPVATEAGGTKNKADVPEALANNTSDELQADLIDPAPAEKKKQEPVVVDDGGLSLDDDAAPVSASSSESESADAEADLANEEINADSTTADNTDTNDKTQVNDKPPVTEPTASVEPEPVEPEPVKPEPVVEQATVAESRTDEVPPAATAPEAAKPANNGVVSGGLVLPGQLSNTVVPVIVPEENLDNTVSSATDTVGEAATSPAMQNDESIEDSEHDSPTVSEAANEQTENEITQPAGKKGRKKIAAVATVAGLMVLAGAGTFAFMSAGSQPTDKYGAAQGEFTRVKDAKGTIEEMHVEVATLGPNADLDRLSTGELLQNLSNNQTGGIVELEPYFIESGDAVRRGPRLGAAVPAESERMILHRKPHPADSYFDEWSSREGDLSLFLALMDKLVEKGDLEVAQQLSDRAKDKLFSVMSTQRLARAYSDVGENKHVTRLMSLASRDTYAIKAPEERVLALSDFAFTQQAIGLNEDAMDTFLKTSILARSLVRPEKRAVGLSSAALYFHRSGRARQAKDLLVQSLHAGNDLPANTAARDLAVRYIALSEARMGLFNQAIEHAMLILDPVASVSAYHGIALAIESSGDYTNARRVLNMAFRAGSLIEDKEERSKLLSKVVLASESE